VYNAFLEETFKCPCQSMPRWKTNAVALCWGLVVLSLLSPLARRIDVGGL